MTAQLTIPSPSRDWILFRLSRPQHARLCGIARRRRGNLALLLYAVAHDAFPDIVPDRPGRQVRNATNTYMGILHVKLFLPSDQVARIVQLADGGRMTEDDYLTRSLKRKFLKNRPQQANLFDHASPNT